MFSRASVKTIGLEGQRQLKRDGAIHLFRITVYVQIFYIIYTHYSHYKSFCLGFDFFVLFFPFSCKEKNRRGKKIVNFQYSFPLSKSHGIEMTHFRQCMHRHTLSLTLEQGNYVQICNVSTRFWEIQTTSFEASLKGGHISVLSCWCFFPHDPLQTIRDISFKRRRKRILYPLKNQSIFLLHVFNIFTILWTQLCVWPMAIH